MLTTSEKYFQKINCKVVVVTSPLEALQKSLSLFFQEQKLFEPFRWEQAGRQLNQLVILASFRQRVLLLANFLLWGVYIFFLFHWLGKDILLNFLNGLGIYKFILIGFVLAMQES